MDSLASSPVGLSSTKGPPAAPTLLIRAPLSSPEEEVDPSAASGSPSPSSATASASEQEYFLSGEDEPEAGFETASERPFVPEPDEEGGNLEDEVEPASPGGERAPPPAFFLRKPPAAMPKARLSMEDEDAAAAAAAAAEEVFDDGLVSDVDGEGPQVVRVAPPLDGEGVGDGGSVDGGAGVLGKDGGDDDEKRAGDVGVSKEVSPGGDTNLEVGIDDGIPGCNEEAMEGLVLMDSTKQGGFLAEVQDEVSGDNIQHENPVSDGGAAAELPYAMGSGARSATVVVENVEQDAGEDEHVVLGDGGEQWVIPDAEAVGDLEVLKLQSSFGAISGTEERAGSDGQCKVGEGSGSAAEEEKVSVTQVVLELEPDEANSEVNAEESGARYGPSFDNNIETVSTTTVESHELQPSDTKEITGYTEEEEDREKAAVSSETKERDGEVEGNGALKVVGISVGPRDAESSLLKPDHSSTIEGTGVSVPSESKKEKDEVEQVLLGETGEEISAISQAAMKLKSNDANSEDTTEESGVHADCGVVDNLEKVSTAHVETQHLQPSVITDIIWDTMEEEEKTIDSYKIKKRIGKVENDDAPKQANISVGSGDVEHSLEKADHLDRTDSADVSISSDLKKEAGKIEQASAELQVSSKEAKLNIDASGNDVYSAIEKVIPAFLAEDFVNEKPESEVAKVLEAAENGSGSVISVASDLKNNNDSSEDTDNEEPHENLNEGETKSVVTNFKTAEQIMKGLEEGSSGTSSTYGSSRDYSNEMDGQLAFFDEEMETDDEGDGKELFDSAALAALLKAVTGGSSDGSVTVTSPDPTRIFSVDHPAGLGSSAASLEPAPRTIRSNIFSPSELAVVGESESSIDEEEKKLQEKIEQIRVKFLRLVHRLGHSPEDRVAAQVLYRLGLAEGIKRRRQIGQSFSFENAKKKALQLEENEKETLDFSCNILVIGKTGVGKSATINSIFGEEKVDTDAFEPVTTPVKEIIGTVDGIRLCVIDTPGLRPSVMDQAANMRTLASIKKYTKKCPPDIVLYVDRLDTQTWDFNDLPLLRSITSTLGSSIWFNAIIALTHAASAPPDGPNGSPLTYEIFVDQRSRVVQHAIRQASGDMRFMNPMALVENHPSCRRNREGERVLPNGLSWRTHMLLLCYSSKILSDANSLLKLQDTSPGKLFGFRARSPPLPFLLSSLLQSRAHPKLSTDQGVDNGDSDIDLGDLSDSDQEEEEEEYDQLPPFNPLRKAQIAKLTREQRKAYFDEYDYRVKLLRRKQWKEELKRLKEIQKRGKADKSESDYGDMVDDYEGNGAPATVPVPLPDMVLPPSFDCNNPAYRYRFLEPTSQLIVRPVLDTHGWDHDCGYDGVSLEENLAIASKFPVGISVQITKDKKDFSIHLESSASAKHGENGSTLAGFDIQSVGKQLAYILRSETKFRSLKKNKTAAGISVTFLGENIATGLKVEDQLIVGKRLGLVASTGAVRAQGDVAYGANLEVRLREKDFPIGQDVSTLGLSLMKWRSDLALGTNLQSQFSVGRNTKMAVRLGLNNKLRGQITVRTSTSEQLQVALMGILPIAVSVYRSIWSGETY